MTHRSQHLLHYTVIEWSLALSRHNKNKNNIMQEIQHIAQTPVMTRKLFPTEEAYKVFKHSKLKKTK